MKKIYVCFLIVVFTRMTGIAQAFDPVFAARLQAVLDSACTVNNFTGLSAAVLFPGQGLWTGTSGISTTGVPLTPEMRFGVASNTKLFIATAIMKLHEMGILSVDDPLYEWLPPLPNIDSSITIRQLLQHQSGIYSYFQGEPGPNWATLTWNDTSHFWTTDEILAYQGQPNFPPGHGTKYCNTGFMIAGMVIDSASASSWVQKLHDLTFTPLTLDSTFVGAYENRNGPLAHEWCYNGVEISEGPITALYSIFGPCGAVFSTPQEMVYWYDHLYNGGFLSDSALKILTSYEPSSAMGLGLFVRDNNFTGTYIYEHSGDSYGYHSETVFLQNSKACISMMTNGGSANLIVSSFFPLLEEVANKYPKKIHDAGISEISCPHEIYCTATLIPAVRLKNYGSASLTSVNIHYSMDNQPPVSMTWNGSLSSGQQEWVSLPLITAADGRHTFRCYTSGPNGSAEGYLFNDTLWSTFQVNLQTSVPASLVEGFEGPDFPPPGWITDNHLTTNWGRTGLTSYGGTHCAVRPAAVDINYGLSYCLTTPVVNVTNVSNPELRFCYAYQYTSGCYDSLFVEVSNDCGLTWIPRFAKGYFDLTTVNFYTPDRIFYPQQASHWKEIAVSLAADTGNILIRFRSYNWPGNNLYLDNVRIGNFTGMQDQQGMNAFVVYPNPTTGLLYVTGLPLQSEILLTDITGRLISSMIMNKPSVSVDLRKMPPGIYLIRTALGTKKVVRL
ncbi:MAG TPA: serine hydrolase [Bacteroidales bacterium]|nr:serine hydrolase [Bacteroidales bacterium]HSA44862.1 serine hydrolase [Bacteroidales bacterium]